MLTSHTLTLITLQHSYSHLKLKISQTKFLSKNTATFGPLSHQSPAPRSEVPPTNSNFRRCLPSSNLSPFSHNHLIEKKKVTRRASWWGAVMPVVVKEAFRHDLDSCNQRKVLQWIAATKKDFVGIDLFEM